MCDRQCGAVLTLMSYMLQFLDYSSYFFQTLYHVIPKVALGDEASVMHVIEHMRRNGGITEELESTLYDPVKVKVAKVVRKNFFEVGESKIRFEFTGAIRFFLWFRLLVLHAHDVGFCFFAASLLVGSPIQLYPTCRHMMRDLLLKERHSSSPRNMSQKCVIFCLLLLP